jgi:hypothetical protein
MKKSKKRLLWAAILLLLFLPPCYYLKSSFLDRDTQLEREKLLVRKQIGKPAQPPEAKVEEVRPDQAEQPLTTFPDESRPEQADTAPTEGVSAPTPGEALVPGTAAEEAREVRRKELESKIRRLEQELLAKDKSIKDWKRRWEEKNRELEGYKRDLLALREETLRKEGKPTVQIPPARPEERAAPGVKEKPAVPPLMATALAECEGVPLSHRELALFLCKGLHLGSGLSYDQAVVVLNGVGISPGTGWSLEDPSFPIGAGELEEILSRVERGSSIGLMRVNYSELASGIKQACKREKARVVGAPQCEGPMVTECVGCEISYCDFAIYVAKVLGIVEALNCDQCFVALGALGIAPRGGWRGDDPYALMTQREIEEIRCFVRKAFEKGCIETDPTVLVVSINDYCRWLKMSVRIVGEGTVADAVALSDYQGGSGISIPRGGSDGGGVASASE